MSEPTGSWSPQQAQEPAPQPSPAGRSLPGSAMAAAIVLFVFAVLAGLVSVLMLVSSAFYDQIPNSGTGLTDDQFRSAMAMGRVFVVFLGIVGLLIALAHALSGAGIIRRRGWGRILGIVIASLGALLSAFVLISVLIALTQPISPASLNASGLTAEQYRSVAAMGFAIGLVIFGGVLACYLFVLIVLIRTGAAFH